MSELGVLLIGPGWVAGRHLSSFLENPYTEIRAIAGSRPRDKAHAEAYMQELGFRCPFYEDWESALRREDIDLVSICTVNSQHFPMGLAALEAGKHVLVEKPLCFSREQARRLVEAAERAGVGTHVGHVVRYYPLVQHLLRFVRKGGVGEVYYCESDYWHEIKGSWKVSTETAGSSLLMGGCHSVDIVLAMMGEECRVDEVFAFSAHPRRRMDFEYDPTISVLMKFENGALGKVSTSLECLMPYVFHLQVNGTEGTIRNHGIFSRHFRDSKGFMKLHAEYPDDPDVKRHPFGREIDDFVRCIREGRESPLSFRRVWPVYEVIFAAQDSVLEGRPVRLR